MTQPSLLDVPSQFDGDTFDAEHDQARLETQLAKVRSLMLDGQWRTLCQIQAVCGGSEAGISARLRDLRKLKNGGYAVERQRVLGGLYAYRVVS